MAGSKTTKPRAKRQKAPEKGTLIAARNIVWEALTTAQRCFSARDMSTRLKAVHAAAQAAGSFERLHEAVGVEGRLAAIEAELVAGKDRP